MNNFLIIITSNLAYFLLLYYLCSRIYNRIDKTALIAFLIISLIKSVLPVNPVISISCYTMCLLLYDRRNLMADFALKILIIVLFMGATFFSETLTLVLISLFTGLSANVIVINQTYVVVANVICILIQTMLVSCIISIFKICKIVPKTYICIMLAILPVGMILIVIAIVPLILSVPKTNLFLALSLLFFLISLSTLLYAFAKIVRNIDYKHKYEIEIKKQALDQEYYTRFETSIEKLKIIKHDISKHYRSMDNLLSTGQYKEAQKYIKALLNDVQSTVLEITGIKQIDMVLYAYHDLFIKHNIDVKYTIQSLDFNDIEPSDMTIILGNIIDNALYSCIHSEQKQIKIILSSHESYRILKVINSCDRVDKCNDKYISIKRDGEMSYGLESIQRCVDRYDAHCTFDYDKSNHIFSSSVIFLKKESEDDQ